jgi:hypothetical protein
VEVGQRNEEESERAHEWSEAAIMTTQQEMAPDCHSRAAEITSLTN